MPGASWPFTTHYPMVYPVGADGSNAASAANGLPVTFTTSILGAVKPVASGVSTSSFSFTAGSALSISASNSARMFLMFQAACETQAWIAFATAAASGIPAISVSGTSGKGGPVLRFDGLFVPKDSITVFCQSAASFVLIEG